MRTSPSPSSRNSSGFGFPPLYQRWRGGRKGVRMFFVLLLLVLSLLADLALASYISFKTTVTSKMEGNTLRILVSAVNEGDEAAHNVQAEIRLGDKKILAGKKDQLEVDQTYVAHAAFEVPFKNPGQYPLVITLHYTDANQYPFSALSVHKYTYKHESPAEIVGQLRSAKFTQKGKIEYVLRNMSHEPISVFTRVVSPRELSVKNDRIKFLLAARSSKSLPVEIENFSALPGSTYQVYAITEYEKGGGHFSVVSPGTVSVIEKNIFKQYQIFFFALIAILLAAFVLLQQKKK